MTEMPSMDTMHSGRPPLYPSRCRANVLSCHGRRDALKADCALFDAPETGKLFVDLKAGFALACSNAGIEGLTWHTLRRAFASRLLDRNAEIVTVQRLLAHSAVKQTAFARKTLRL
jgi:integrase